MNQKTRNARIAINRRPPTTPPAITPPVGRRTVGMIVGLGDAAKVDGTSWADVGGGMSDFGGVATGGSRAAVIEDRGLA